MAGLSSAGIGSGLDVSGLVSSLVAAEREPFALTLNRQESRTNYQLSGLGELKSALAKLNDALEALGKPEAVDGRNTRVEDEAFFTATATAGAGIGNYSVEVLQLAQAHRMATATPIASPLTNVGYGQLDISLGGSAFSVTIDSGAQTLKDVQNAINNAPDNPGVVASIINGDSGAILTLSSTETGTTSEIQISASGGDGGLNTLVADLGTTQAFQDAIIKIDGQQVTSSSNSVSSAIDGVTINLLQGTAGSTYNLDISRNDDPTTEAFKTLVEAYNEFAEVADRIGSSDSEGKAAGSLNGDSLLRGLQNQLRVALSGQYGSGNTNSLVEMGISIDVDGRMSLNETKLEAALASDYSGVRSFLNATDGFAVSLEAFTDRYIKSDGMLSDRIGNLNDKLEQISDRRDALDVRMEQVQARYLKQFTALDAMLAQMQQISSYLATQLSNLPGAGGNS